MYDNNERFNRLNDTINIESFSKHLFWDVKKDKLNMENNKFYIIGQVLEHGKYMDWQLIYKYYGLTQITEVAKNMRSLDKKTLAFISLISDTPKEEFRCYTYQQSIPLHWNF